MSSGEAWFCIGMAVLGLLVFLVGWWAERKETNAYYHRLHTDPEFARQQQEIHEYDDWEDLGYFDGR